MLNRLSVKRRSVVNPVGALTLTRLTHNSPVSLVRMDPLHGLNPSYYYPLTGIQTGVWRGPVPVSPLVTAPENPPALPPVNLPASVEVASAENTSWLGWGILAVAGVALWWLHE